MYGRILRDVPSEESQERGLNWIRAAARQGFEEAVEELGE